MDIVFLILAINKDIIYIYNIVYIYKPLKGFINIELEGRWYIS